MMPIQFVGEWGVRSSVLLLAGALLIGLLRVKSPSIRQMAWSSMLAGSLAIPLLTAVLPNMPFDIAGAPGAFAPVFDTAHSRLEADVAVSASIERVSADALRGSPATTALNWMSLASILYAVAVGILLLRLLAGIVLSQRILRRSRPAGSLAGLSPVRESSEVVSPVTIGILRPAIVLPLDWRDWESPKLNAVLAHERSHIRRRDPALQFLSAVHRSLLWVSPLSWMLHRNLVRTAEEISDDDAVGELRDRVSYAEILLEFAQRGIGRSGAPGIAMASYDRPERRIRRILNSTGVSRAATRWSAAAILLMAVPLSYLAAAADPEPAPQSTSQATPKPVRPRFETASIKLAPPDTEGAAIYVGFRPMPGGGLRARNITLTELITRAYKLDYCYDKCRDFISGGPGWMYSARYDIEARVPSGSSEHTDARGTMETDQLRRERLQTLLADRFQLVIRQETKTGQTYALQIAKHGTRLKRGTDEGAHQLMAGTRELIGENASMEELAAALKNLLGYPVTDNTGLAGKYNFKLQWSPFREESATKADLTADISGLFSVLQSELGLRLEPVKGPVTKLVVVRAEPPSEN